MSSHLSLSRRQFAGLAAVGLGAAALPTVLGRGRASAAEDRGLHVEGRGLVDGNGEPVLFRTVEHVIRWGDYDGEVPWGNVPWEGGAHDSTGSQLPDIARTGANSVRLMGGQPHELEPLLHQAVIEHKMWVSIARVNWRDPTVIAAINKYARYVSLHIKGETITTDENVWREEAVRDITEARALGFTSPIEIYTTSYGQRLSTILHQGDAVAAADPLRNTVFGYQLYSELAPDVNGALDATVNFGHPILVGACLFQGGIDQGWGNTPNTYKEVWDGTAARDLSSTYWAWSGDGEGNNMTHDGSLDNRTPVGDYLVHESPYALSSFAPKTEYLLNSWV
ncbi:hypothetical protein FH609_024375 [Streptomyces sp. 3MP-14]|uniref:Uncharacterized protein n=1 Tax=Streptomyces mimosae TaxID=2586635 RepID=A0A5N6A1A1_9ACTN|nr:MULTISPECIES: hypothetical protein [Streptomyces]KAB8162235.1 hypothetical protein FH607_022360 [Streptomyces mimosae]KAB8173866.1 hypothetical protein FH609_024375 [Streptomyces sp. 3MP-14]